MSRSQKREIWIHEREDRSKGRLRTDRWAEGCEEDSQWALGLTRLSLDSLGLWPHKNDSTTIAFLRESTIPLIVLYNSLVLYLPQLYALYQVFPDFPSVIDILSTNMALLTNALKVLFMWKNRKVLFTVTREAISDWLKPKSSWERSVMMRQAGLARVFSIAAFVGIFATVTSFSIMPFVGITPRILNRVIDPGMDEGRFFPLQVYFPFDAMASPVFEIMYFLSGVACFLEAVTFVTPDAIFGALVLHVSAQFAIIGDKMSHIFDGIQSTRDDEKKLFQVRLKQVVNAHVRCIRFVKNVETVFNMVILFQLIGLCIISCLFGYGIIDSLKNESGGMPVMRAVMRAQSVSTFALQVLIYCSASEILAGHSSNLVDRIYSSRWYDVPCEYSRQMVPIMALSKYPMRLTAGKFVDLSLNLFIRVCKTSFSYLSVLLAVND